MTKLEKEIAALEAEREELERLAQELENDEVYDIDEYEDDRFLNGVPYDQLSFVGKIRCKMKPILRKLYIPRCICSFAALTALIPGGIVALQMMSTSNGTGFLDPTAMAILMLLAI
ncbi:MAG: hypothetical protein IKZ19_08475, partial [Clostridia bacterium]|nr:hypothetical protein [Clostridia bacterium]